MWKKRTIFSINFSIRPAILHFNFAVNILSVKVLPTNCMNSTIQKCEEEKTLLNIFLYLVPFWISFKKSKNLCEHNIGVQRVISNKICTNQNFIYTDFSAMSAEFSRSKLGQGADMKFWFDLL